MARSGWDSLWFKGKPHQCPLVSQAHRKLLLDWFCQQAAHEFHGVAVYLHHKIWDALEGWMAQAPQLIRQCQQLKNSQSSAYWAANKHFKRC